MLSGRSDFGEVSKRRISISSKDKSVKMNSDSTGTASNGETTIMLLGDL